MIFAFVLVLSSPWCHDICYHFSPLFFLLSWYLQSSQSSLSLDIMLFSTISVLSSLLVSWYKQSSRSSFCLGVMIIAIISVLSSPWYHDICNHLSPLLPFESWYWSSSFLALPWYHDICNHLSPLLPLVILLAIVLGLSSPWCHDICNYLLFTLMSWYLQSSQASLRLGIVIFVIILVLSSLGIMIFAIISVLSYPLNQYIGHHHSSLPLGIMIFAIISVLSSPLVSWYL